MLSKSAARKFFLTGTVLCSGAFVLLTLDTLKQIPRQTHQDQMTEAVVRGKHLWDRNNCMGCHTIYGEGAYYAPELTKVYERRGAEFIKAMLKDPEAMYPGQRKMKKYDFTESEREDLVAFFKWVGEVDLNGFPAKTEAMKVAEAAPPAHQVAAAGPRPAVFGQLCSACHAIGGQGGNVGPALDDVGSRRSLDYIAKWLKDPATIKPDSKMPKLPLAEADIASLANYLSRMTGATK